MPVRLNKQVDRAHREFTPTQVEFLANIVRLYRGEAVENAYGSQHSLFLNLLILNMLFHILQSSLKYYTNLLSLAMSIFATFKTAFQTLADTHPELKLLVLFGSRARGEDDPSSDWDFAFLSDPDRTVDRKLFWFPGSELLATLSNLLQVSDEKIDLVDLSTCSAMLAHFVARDGQMLYEQTPGEFTRFQQQALKTKTELKQFRQIQRENVQQTVLRWGL